MTHHEKSDVLKQVEMQREDGLAAEVQESASGGHEGSKAATKEVGNRNVTLRYREDRADPTVRYLYTYIDGQIDGHYIYMQLAHENHGTGNQLSVQVDGNYITNEETRWALWYKYRDIAEQSTRERDSLFKIPKDFKPDATDSADTVAKKLLG